MADADGSASLVHVGPTGHEPTICGLVGLDRSAGEGQSQLQTTITSFSSQLGHIDVSEAIDAQKFDKQMEISQVDEEQMRMSLNDSLQVINKKMDDMISAIPTDNPETAQANIQLVSKLVEMKSDMVRSGLDAAFALHKAKLKKWKEDRKTLMEVARELLQKAIETYSDKVKAVMDSNAQVHTQRLQQADDLLNHQEKVSVASAEHKKSQADAMAYREQQELEAKKRKIELIQEKEKRDNELALEKAEKEAEAMKRANEAILHKAEKEAEAQKRQSEALLDKALKVAEARQRANEVAHEKAQRDAEIEKDKAERALEKAEKEQEINENERKMLWREFDKFNEIYLKDLDLATKAMEKAIEKGGRCEMKHSPPRICWTPAPPHVHAGSVSWKLIQ